MGILFFLAFLPHNFTQVAVFVAETVSLCIRARNLIGYATKLCGSATIFNEKEALHTENLISSDLG